MLKLHTAAVIVPAVVSMAVAFGEDAAPPGASAELIAVWNGTVSFTGTTTLKQYPSPSGAEGFTAKGKASYLKHDGQVRSRQFLRYEPDSATAAYGITNVFDGQVQWIQRPAPEKIEVYKMPRRPDPSDFLSYADWTAHFETLAGIAKLVWLADEPVHGHESFVLDVTPTQVNPENPVRTMRSHFSKEYGIPLTAAGFDENGRLVYEWSFEIESVNQPIDLDTFQFQLPANAELRDLTDIEQ